MRLVPFLLVTLLLVGSGCGAKSAKVPPGGAATRQEEAAGVDGQQAVQAPAAPGANEAPARKIIYTAAMTLVAEDFARAEQELLRLVKDNAGYVINSEVRGSPGAPRLGQWKVRIPVARFDAFRDAVARLGELERNTTDSQDVTDEYYDLEARIKNKKIEEARLLDHLQKSTGKLNDILAVEHEISRVRGEVEQMQGRLQMLAKLTAMTTVTITLHERKSYVPPANPTFGTTIARTFGGSLDALLELGKTIVLIAVALGPWLPLLALVCIPLGLAWRRRHRLPAAPRLPLAVEEPPLSAGT